MHDNVVVVGSGLGRSVEHGESLREMEAGLDEVGARGGAGVQQGEEGVQLPLCLLEPVPLKYCTGSQLATMFKH